MDSFTYNSTVNATSHRGHSHNSSAHKAGLFVSIPGTDGRYLASSDGFIYSAKQDGQHRRLKSARGHVGHRSVTIRRYGKTQQWGVHRLIVESFMRPLLPGECALHKDDDPSNNAIDNLWIGTQLDNIQDCVSKRRHTWGKRNGRAKLTDDDVINIRTSRDGCRVLAKRYGVSLATMKAAASGRTWKHIKTKRRRS